MEGRIVDGIGTKVKDKRLWVVLEAEYWVLWSCM